MSRLGWIAGLIVLTASPSLAQAHRQALLELATVLGQSHALRQACEGEGDQYWRSWMGRLLETEAPDEAFDRRLRGNFNGGYAAAQARFPECTDAARAEAARAASRGRDLSRAVAGG